MADEAVLEDEALAEAPVTQIGPDGKRVSVDDLDQSSPEVVNAIDKIDPATQINSEGKRVPADEVDPDAPSASYTERVESGAVSEDDAEEGAVEEPEDELATATKEELYEKAQELEIEGRSSMSRDELEVAVRAELEG